MDERDNEQDTATYYLDADDRKKVCLVVESTRDMTPLDFLYALQLFINEIHDAEKLFDKEYNYKQNYQ